MNITKPHVFMHAVLTVAAATSETNDLESQIRQRAHELYQERGGEDGHELDDWLRAEEELTEKKVRPIAA